jgi:uncharacterized protein YndB with AHSA1/START domain
MFSIHQEVVFQASRKRVYEALTDPKQFAWNPSGAMPIEHDERCSLVWPNARPW